jgi:hypothetical protein
LFNVLSVSKGTKELWFNVEKAPTGGNGMFNSNASARKIYVPMVSVDAYKSAEYWSGYSGAIEGYNF